MCDDLNIKIIELVQANPCLYDQTRSDYSNRNKQDQKWGEIAQQLNETVETIREKWKNIRWRYVKQLKQQPSGSAAKPKKPYYLAERLHFLDTFIRSRTPTGNLQPQTADIDETQSNDYFEEQSNSIPNVSDEAVETSTPSTPEPGTSTSQSKYYRRKIKQTVTLNDLNKSAMNYFEDRNKRQNSAKIAQDPDEAFLTSVLPDMKNMTEAQKRNFKVAVLRIAGEILNQPVVMPPSIPALNSATSQASNPSPSNSNNLLTSLVTSQAINPPPSLHNETFYLPQYSVVSQENDPPSPNPNTQQFLNFNNL